MDATMVQAWAFKVRGSGVRSGDTYCEWLSGYRGEYDFSVTIGRIQYPRVRLRMVADEPDSAWARDEQRLPVGCFAFTDGSSRACPEGMVEAIEAILLLSFGREYSVRFACWTDAGWTFPTPSAPVGGAS